MRVVAEPVLSEWRVTPRDGTRPVIATGHQAWLWHPGILAKDMAAAVYAERVGGRVVHLVVDHDQHETMQVALPIVEGERLRIEVLRLAEPSVAKPTGCQPAADGSLLRKRIDEASVRGDVDADLWPLREAVAALDGSATTLAEQVAALTVALMRPHVGEVEIVYSSRLLAQIDGQSLVDRMLRDARRCVVAYNAAVRAHPEAGVATLTEERERVELPLWQLEWDRPRRKVYADLADEPAILTYEDGTSIADDERHLAPKALLLTALMRSRFCDLFIHGLGGGVYDRVMEAWWSAWTGEPLAPMAVVTADVHLPFGVPIADRAERDRAVWYRHHLPHNIDRVTGQDCARCVRKRELLAAMPTLGTRREKRAAFDEVHGINDALAAEHAEAVREAEAGVRRAEAGVRNAAVARRRDWCFALYSAEVMARLREAFVAQADA